MLLQMQLNNLEEMLVLQTTGWVHLMEVPVNYGQMELQMVHLLIISIQLLQQTALRVMLLKCKI